MSMSEYQTDVLCDIRNLLKDLNKTTKELLEEIKKSNSVTNLKPEDLLRFMVSDFKNSKEKE